jgi:uncharacterized membrane protein YphA (DoxX/SURF4 family)
LLLVFGVLSPLVSGAAAVVSLLALALPQWRALASVRPFLLGALSLAVFLLGPGSCSVDARLFGRREIVIPARRSRK